MYIIGWILQLGESTHVRIQKFDHSNSAMKTINIGWILQLGVSTHVRIQKFDYSNSAGKISFINKYCLLRLCSYYPEYYPENTDTGVNTSTWGIHARSVSEIRLLGVSTHVRIQKFGFRNSIIVIRLGKFLLSINTVYWDYVLIIQNTIRKILTRVLILQLGESTHVRIQKFDYSNSAGKISFINKYWILWCYDHIIERTIRTITQLELCPYYRVIEKNDHIIERTIRTITQLVLCPYYREEYPDNYSTGVMSILSRRISGQLFNWSYVHIIEKNIRTIIQLGLCPYYREDYPDKTPKLSRVMSILTRGLSGQLFNWGYVHIIERTIRTTLELGLCPYYR